MLLAPVVRARKGEHRDILDGLRRQGFLRARIDGEVRLLEEPVALDKKRKPHRRGGVDRNHRRPDRGRPAGRLGGGGPAPVARGVLVAAVVGARRRSTAS